MERPVADFAKVVQKQWQEDQLREEIQRLIDTLKAKEKRISDLENDLNNITMKAKQMEKELSSIIAEKDKMLKEKNAQLIDKDETISNLKREVSNLRVLLEREKNKSLIDFIRDKRKKDV